MLLYLLTFIDDESDKHKLEAIYNKYSSLMKYIALNILNDNDAADDAVSDAFLKLIKHIDKIDEVDCHKTKSFIVLVIKRTAIDICRKKKEVFIEDTAQPETISYTDDAVDRISVAELKEKIAGLPESYRDIIMLKVYYSFTEKEIAAFLKISYAAARKRLQRARNALLRSINDER